MPWIDVKTFGAKGDGVTDDTVAVRNALNTGIGQKKPVLFPTGTYIISPAVIALTLSSGQSLVMEGEGPDSVIKRKANSTNADWKWLFSITSAGGDAETVMVANLKVDSNARQNPVPPNPYDFEHSADFYIRGGGPASYINHVAVRNVWCTDGVADHFYFSGTTNAYIRSVSLSDFTSQNRNRTRSDITVTGGVEVLNAVNVVCDRFEIELNSAYDGPKPMVVNLSNILCRQQMDLEGGTPGATRAILLNGSNLVAKDGFTLTGLRGTISNSVFYTKVGDRNRVNFLYDFTFQNCMWMLHTEADGNGKTTGNGLLVDYEAVELTFDGCSFSVNDTVSSVNGYGLTIDPWNVPTSRYIIVRNCTFDKRLRRNLYLNRGGNVSLVNNRYTGSDHVMTIFGSGSYPLILTVDGGDFSQVKGKMFYHKDADNLTLSMNNLAVPSSLTSGYSSDNSAYLPSVTVNERVVYVTAPPSATVKYGGIKGDTLRLATPVNGQPCEWVATNTSKTNCTWLVTKTARLS